MRCTLNIPIANYGFRTSNGNGVMKLDFIRQQSCSHKHNHQPHAHQPIGKPNERTDALPPFPLSNKAKTFNNSNYAYLVWWATALAHDKKAANARENRDEWSMFCSWSGQVSYWNQNGSSYIRDVTYALVHPSNIPRDVFCYSFRFTWPFFRS